MDNDDEKGSRGIPSRTGLGKRGSVIEKFPSLGQSLILFGGLVTIPMWGYLNMPVALLDVMLADLPHIQYHPKNTVSKEADEAATIISRDMRSKIKQKGLRGIKGLNLNFNQNKIIDGNALLKGMK